MKINKIYQGDCLEVLKTFPDESINCVMTSPPYWALRDYGIEGQLGLEPIFQDYINKLCDIFDEVKRVLRKDGTCFVNIGDTYYTKSGGAFLNDQLNGTKRVKNLGINKANEIRGRGLLEDKNLTLTPLRFAIEMQKRGWIVRNVIIWHKPNCMPCSVRDRFTVDFEYLFFFVKNKKYWFETQREGTNISTMDNSRVRDVIKNRIKYSGTRAGQNEIENYEKDKYSMIGRNKRTVWRICPKPFKESHFATYPEELCETPIKAGCPEFICNKCGKAREKIMKPTEEYAKLLNQSWTEDTDKSKELRNKIGFKVNTKKVACCSDYVFDKWNECNCQEGFSGGICLDPFFGAGTTGLVALKQNKKFVGIELNPEYIKIAENRLKPYLEQRKL
jgi:site-specific DNA-methyltransferase (adenine-specific)